MVMAAESESEGFDKPHVVAVKALESELNKPLQEQWRSVKCTSCSDVFFIGPTHVLNAGGKTQHYVKVLEYLLAEDHKQSRPHRNNYDLY
jgi:hypothetical protein